MDSLTDFALNEEYKRIEHLGDKRAQVEAMIDWEAFRHVVAGCTTTGAMSEAEST